MIFLALGVGVLAILVWAGRSPADRRPELRIICALFAAVAAAGAVVSGLRGGWLGSVGLLAVSAWLAQSARPAAKRTPSERPSEPMSDSQARAILGIGPDASNAQVEAAYRRLIVLGHPDRGGSSVLAAQLNAARDRLLKRRT